MPIQLQLSAVIQPRRLGTAEGRMKMKESQRLAAIAAAVAAVDPSGGRASPRADDDGGALAD